MTGADVALPFSWPPAAGSGRARPDACWDALLQSRHFRLGSQEMGTGHESDEQLMLRYRDGEAAAFETLYQRHRGGLFRYLLRQVSDRSTAEELFQEIWFSLIRARERYAIRAKFSTMLYRMAHNRVVDHYRSKAHAVAVRSVDLEDPPADAVHDGSPAPEQQLDLQRQVARFQGLLAGLPAEQREAFVLREEAGMSIQDIAQTTGVGIETAKSRLRYAVSRLRAGMSSDP